MEESIYGFAKSRLCYESIGCYQKPLMEVFLQELKKNINLSDENDVVAQCWNDAYFTDIRAWSIKKFQ